MLLIVPNRTHDGAKLTLFYDSFFVHPTAWHVQLEQYYTELEQQQYRSAFGLTKDSSGQPYPVAAKDPSPGESTTELKQESVDVEASATVDVKLEENVDVDSKPKKNIGISKADKGNKVISSEKPKKKKNAGQDGKKKAPSKLVSSKVQPVVADAEETDSKPDNKPDVKESDTTSPEVKKSDTDVRDEVRSMKYGAVGDSPVKCEGKTAVKEAEAKHTTEEHDVKSSDKEPLVKNSVKESGAKCKSDEKSKHRLKGDSKDDKHKDKKSHSDKSIHRHRSHRERSKKSSQDSKHRRDSKDGKEETRKESRSRKESGKRSRLNSHESNIESCTVAKEEINDSNLGELGIEKARKQLKLDDAEPTSASMSPICFSPPDSADVKPNFTGFKPDDLGVVASKVSEIANAASVNRTREEEVKADKGSNASLETRATTPPVSESHLKDIIADVKPADDVKTVKAAVRKVTRRRVKKSENVDLLDSIMAGMTSRPN